MHRRAFIQALLGTGAALGLSSCAVAAAQSTPLATDSPLASAVPSGASLSIASYTGLEQLQLKLAGLLDKLPFTVSAWPSIGAGPDVINAFRARSLEVANNAGIPPIQAHYQGFDARIVAVDLTRKPGYVFATKPGSDIHAVADFRGKRLAFSQGQAQGVVLLRALKKAGLKYSDVTLVNLTSNQFLTALQAGQVDIAPLAISQLPSYLSRYASDGARAITTDVVDLLNVLWAPTSVLADKAKAAAVAAYVPLWAKGQVWVWENPEVWEQEYYVKNQNITLAQAKGIIALSSKPLFPPSWDEAIAWEQETIDLLAAGGFVKSFKADVLFDRRFEHLASDAVAAQYRS
jgi:sulfonate transport system substrate-binding protein